MTILTWFAYFLSAVGAINWGLTEFLKINIVEELCKMVRVDYLKEVLYGVISVCGLYVLLSLFL